jgi:hypothetical protein
MQRMGKRYDITLRKEGRNEGKKEEKRRYRTHIHF